MLALFDFKNVYYLELQAFEPLRWHAVSHTFDMDEQLIVACFLTFISLYSFHHFVRSTCQIPSYCYILPERLDDSYGTTVTPMD